MMIGAQHVDETREPPLALLQMIGDIGREVGLLAVLAHHHAILLVAELGGAEPERAVAPLQPSTRFKHRERVIDRAAVRQRTL